MLFPGTYATFVNNLCKITLHNLPPLVTHVFALNKVKGKDLNKEALHFKFVSFSIKVRFAP